MLDGIHYYRMLLLGGIMDYIFVTFIDLCNFFSIYFPLPTVGRRLGGRASED